MKVKQHTLAVILDNKSTLYKRSLDWCHYTIYGTGLFPTKKKKRLEAHKTKLNHYMHSRFCSYLKKQGLEPHKWCFDFIRQQHQKTRVVVELYFEDRV